MAVHSIYLEVRRVSKLPVAVGAGEPGLVGVGHEVVVEAVLPGEGRPAQSTLEGPQSRVTPALQSYKFWSHVTWSASGSHL